MHACDTVYKFKHRKREHNLVCLKRSIPCKYELVIGCEEMARANEMSDHEVECRDQSAITCIGGGTRGAPGARAPPPPLYDSPLIK